MIYKFEFDKKIFQDSEFEEKENCDLRSKLEHTMIYAENCKESLSRRAEEAALEAVHKVNTECYVVFCYLFFQSYVLMLLLLHIETSFLVMICVSEG